MADVLDGVDPDSLVFAGDCVEAVVGEIFFAGEAATTPFADDDGLFPKDDGLVGDSSKVSYTIHKHCYIFSYSIF